jgi:hypothetical protein
MCYWKQWDSTLQLNSELVCMLKRSHQLLTLCLSYFDFIFNRCCTEAPNFLQLLESPQILQIWWTNTYPSRHTFFWQSKLYWVVRTSSSWNKKKCTECESRWRSYILSEGHSDMNPVQRITTERTFRKSQIRHWLHCLQTTTAWLA